MEAEDKAVGEAMKKVRLRGGAKDGELVMVPAFAGQFRIPVMLGYEKMIGPFGFEEDAPIIRVDVYERPAKARINDGIEEWHLLPRTPETQEKNPVTDPTEKDR